MSAGCVYLIALGPIPQWMLRLPDRVNFKYIKDEIREAVDVSILDQLPRVNLHHGLAWFEVTDYDDASATHDILQGHFWRAQDTVLYAFMLQQDRHGLVQLRGPIDSTTGEMLPAPVPLSPPVAPTMDRQRAHTTPMRPQPVSFRQGRAGSSNYGPGRRNVQPLQAGTADPFNQSVGAPTNLSTRHAGVGHPGQQQCVQRSPTNPMTPAFSSSSRNSSISTLSTMMMPPDVASFIATPTFPTISGALGTPYGSRNPSFSNISVASTSLHSSGPILTPPPSVSEYESEPPSPASVHGYKVTIRNLSQDTTKERVYALVEEQTHAYVEMVQPEYIKLRQVHGQVHAFAEFIREKDAKKAVKQLQGQKFMGRTLQATLG